MAVMIISGCASMNKTQKGAAAGTAAGGVTGAVIGKASGNTALSAIIEAAVDGTAGAVIGHQRDKQAEEVSKAIPEVKVIRVGERIVVGVSSNVLFGFGPYARYGISGRETQIAVKKLAFTFILS